MQPYPLLSLSHLNLQAQKCAINVELVGDDYRELRGEIAGPPDTPYEGATFQLEIKVPETYPFNPPKVICYMVGLCVLPYLLEIEEIYFQFDLKTDIKEVKTLWFMIYIDSRWLTWDFCTSSQEGQVSQTQVSVPG